MGAFLGILIGSYVPKLWGSGAFSFSSVIFGGLGGILGIILVYKLLG